MDLIRIGVITMSYNEYCAGVGLQRSGYKGWFLVKRHNEEEPQGGATIFIESGSEADIIESIKSCSNKGGYISYSVKNLEDLPADVKVEIEKLIAGQNPREVVMEKKPKKKILIVDDDPGVRKNIAKLIGNTWVRHMSWLAGKTGISILC